MIYEKSCGVIVYKELWGERLYLIIRSLRGEYGFPKGHVEGGETEYETAKRELKEETGAVPEELISLGSIILSPGCFGETLHLFLARGLKMEEQQLDEDEFLNVERIPFSELYQRICTGEIDDAKTVTAVLKTKILLGL